MTLAPLLVVCVALAAPGPAPSQASPPSPETVERLFRAARDLERDGQAVQARRAYTQLLDADPQGPRAPDALLGLARLSWPINDPAELGARTYDAAALADAEDRLQTIAKKFPGAPAAAEAWWRLALLHLAPGSPQWRPDDGLAQLTTLLRLHPSSPQAPLALALAARLHAEAGRFPRARGLAFRLLLDWPDHPAAARGWLALAEADAREGRFPDALREAGRARQIAFGRDERVARQALGWSTILDRIAFSARRGARPFEFTPGPEMIFTGKPRRLAVGADGALLATLPGDEALASFPVDGAAPSQRAAAGAQFIAVDEWGRVWVGGGATVVGPPGVGSFTLPDRAEIVGLAPSSARSVWVADERGRRVFRFEVGAGIAATARLGEKPELIAVAKDGLGGAWVLDGRGPRIVDVGPDGATKIATPLTGEARDPVDIDVDALGNVYVLDAESPAILLYSPTGKLVLRQPLPKDGEPAFPHPALLAVDQRGAVAVYDARKKKAIWLR